MHAKPGVCRIRVRREIAQVIACKQLNALNTARAKADLEQGTSSSIMSLGKPAMSRILHEEARLLTKMLGAQSLLEGKDYPRAEDANFLSLNACFTSIGGGADQIQRNIIGERVLGLPKEPEADKGVRFREVRTSQALRIDNLNCPHRASRGLPAAGALAAGFDRMSR